MLNLWKWLRRRPRSAPEDYWQDRARQFGSRAVYNLGHPPEALREVDRKQKRVLFPLLRGQLDKTEESLLDFGCGSGRFSGLLAEETGCKVTAVDATRELLALAPAHRKVTYVEARGSSLPFEDQTFDVLWVCLVLGALKDKDLEDTASELIRVSKPNGLLFLVENTTAKPSVPSWEFRPVDEYQRLFPSFLLKHLDDYDDLGERISIAAGRKQ